MPPITPPAPPPVPADPLEMPLPDVNGDTTENGGKIDSESDDGSESTKGSPTAKKPKGKAADAITAAYEQEITEEELPPNASDAVLPALQPASPDAADTTGAIGVHGELHIGNAHGSLPNASAAGSGRPPCCPNNGPVMTHTRIYHGNDGDFTEALANYYHFRNDARFGGWQNYLQRSDDFIRFCCHMHIAEMLSARGGADRTRVAYECCDCR
jgi:hypothetical protein